VTAPVNTATRGRALSDAIDLVKSRLMVADATLHGQWSEVQPALATAAPAAPRPR
jgi:hypothetical protein